MLMPKKTKFRKQMRGRMRGTHILETKLVLVPSDFRQSDEVT